MSDAATNQDQDLSGVEIFKAGTYVLRGPNGKNETISYSEADIQQLAENANALLASQKHEPPAKLGHDDDQALAKMAGLPAIGWVKRVVAKGASLYADFTKVPGLVAEAIRRGRYRHISSEIYDPKQTAENFGDTVKGLSLRAVAFLGADVPVVKGMNPLLLAAGAHGGTDGHVITLEASSMSQAFADSEKKPLMVPANRHPYGALCSYGDHKDGDGENLYHVDNQHRDGSYDISHMHKPEKRHKAVPHDNLTLLSEREHRALKASQEEAMETKEAVKLAEQKAADEKSRADKLAEENKALRDNQRAERINAFAEKHKTLLKQPPLLAALKALAATEISTPVKLAEGKEQPFLDAFLGFAEAIITARPVLFGEIAPTLTKEGDMAKSQAVKLAEEPFKQYAQQNGINEIANASLAVAARQYAEEKKVPLRAALLAVAKERLGGYARGRYAELNAEVA